MEESKVYEYEYKDLNFDIMKRRVAGFLFEYVRKRKCKD